MLDPGHGEAATAGGSCPVEKVMDRPSQGWLHQSGSRQQAEGS